MDKKVWLSAGNFIAFFAAFISLISYANMIVGMRESLPSLYASAKTSMPTLLKLLCAVHPVFYFVLGIAIFAKEFINQKYLLLWVNIIAFVVLFALGGYVSSSNYSLMLAAAHLGHGDKNSLPEMQVSKSYYASGQLQREVMMGDGMDDGTYKYYYENGKVMQEGRVVNGSFILEKRYDQNGNLVATK